MQPLGAYSNAYRPVLAQGLSASTPGGVYGSPSAVRQPALAQSLSPQQPPMMNLLLQMMQVMQQMLQMMLSQQGQAPVQQPDATPAYPGATNPGQPTSPTNPLYPTPGTPPAGGAGNPGGPAQPPGTVGPGPTPPPGTQPPGNTLATPDINRNIDFMFPELDRNNPADLAKLSQLRTQMGLSERDRGILHLWGRQIISKGFQDGSIYNNVLSGNWQDQDEVKLIQELSAKDQAEFGGITGKALDREFFALMQRMNPNERIDTSRWLNAPVRFSNGQPLDIVSDINTLQQRSGLNATEQAALRLWGHDPLTNGGTIDGSVLAYTIGNPNALDSQAKGPNGQNVDIDPIAKALLEADFASDGVRNGDSLRFAFDKVLDKVYLGSNSLNVDQVQQNAQQVAQARGRSVQQIGQDVQQGMTQALADTARFVKDHPIVSAAAVGGVAAATAVCPFLGGLAVGGAGIVAGQNFMNRSAQASGA